MKYIINWNNIKKIDLLRFAGEQSVGCFYMVFLCIDGDCINAFGNTFHSFEAAKPRETQSAQPLYWHSCHSHCSPSAPLYPAKYPSPYHLEPPGKMPCKVRQSAVGFKNGNCTSITSLCPLLQAFFPGQTSDFWAFFVLQVCNCQGQVATCSPSAGQFELSALSRARAQSLGHSGHTMRTADPNKCETSWNIIKRREMSLVNAFKDV